MENLNKEISTQNSDIIECNSIRRCDFCGSKEGEVRKIGNYLVSLIPVSVSGSIKQACQGCSRKHWEIKDYFSKEESGKRKRKWL